MARPLATSALLLLLLSLLAVAHCRTAAVAADHVGEPKTTAAVPLSDENGLSSSPTLPAEAAGASASATEQEEAFPAEQEDGFEFLRLPSHRRPCSLRRHPWWKPHHQVYYRDPACWFHDYDHYSGHDGERREAVSRLAILPAEEARETAEEVKPVAEPDPDRSLPNSDGEGELVDSRELEEMVRRFRKAFLRMRRRFGHDVAEHGRRFFHHLYHDNRHRHSEEAKKQQAGGDEQSGMMAWIKGLMNRF